jgi:hypothetical protein
MVSGVVVASRLQFTMTEGCPDTFDQIVYSVLQLQCEPYISGHDMQKEVLIVLWHRDPASPKKMSGSGGNGKK